MPRITYYVVLPFIRTQDGDLFGVEAEEAPDLAKAKFRARDIVGRVRDDCTIVGAIAFSRSGDPQFGDFDDAVVLARYGETPEDLEGLE